MSEQGNNKKDARKEPATHMERARQERANQYLDEHAEGGRHAQEVKIPTGKMAVTIRVLLDDLHATGHYAPLGYLGADLLLGIVNDGPELEATARRVLERYPELAALSWCWYTENWNIGYGNHLEGPIMGTVDHHAYDGRDTVPWAFEIQFRHGVDMRMLPAKGYPGTGRTDAEG